MKRLILSVALLLLATPAHATWDEVWKEGWDGSATTGRTVTGIGTAFNRFRQAFIAIPAAVAANDDSPAINFTSGTTVCVDTDDSTLAASGATVLNIYWVFGSGGTMSGDGAVLAQNAGGTVALSSGAPCETFSAGRYIIRVATEPGSESAVVHAYSN